MKLLAALLWLFVLCISSSAQQAADVFLVGDSISIYYTPDLTDDLAGIANLSRKMSATPESIEVQLGDPNVQGGDSRMVLTFLHDRYRSIAFRPQVVLVNCGLHDVKHDPKTGIIAVDLQEYEANLRAIEGLVRAHGARLVWINSTPVDDARHNSLSKAFFRYNSDVVRYNSAAQNLFDGLNVPVIDLYRFTAHLGNTHYIDHIHYDAGTRALQAAYIAGYLQSWLSKRS